MIPLINITMRILYLLVHGRKYVFRMYLHHFKNKCSNTQIIKMTEDAWSKIDTDELELIHTISKGATAITILGSSATPSTINAQNVTATYKDISSFLKYVNVKFSGKPGTITFYDNFYAQSQRFDILMRPSKEIPKLL